MNYFQKLNSKLFSASCLDLSENFRRLPSCILIDIYRYFGEPSFLLLHFKETVVLLRKIVKYLP